MGADENWITVAERDALDVRSVIGVKANNLDVALYNIDGEIDLCHAQYLYPRSCPAE